MGFNSGFKGLSRAKHSPGTKRPEHDAVLSLPASCKQQNEWSYTTHTPYALWHSLE